MSKAFKFRERRLTPEPSGKKLARMIVNKKNKPVQLYERQLTWSEVVVQTIAGIVVWGMMGIILWGVLGL